MSRAAEGRPCAFCQVVAGEAEAHRVFEDDVSLAFLDHRPLLPGHLLLVPKLHVPTLLELPDELAGPLLANLRRLAAAVERALPADGSLAAINIKVGQTVPHLHLHLLPRRRPDRLLPLRLLWLRRPYRSRQRAAEVAAAIRAALEPAGGDPGAR